MTEEEKQSAIQSAKERIAGAAVKFATAVSVLSPVAAEAQQIRAAENISPAATHTITADIKNPIEITDIKEAQNQPAFGSEEWLKSQMQADRAEHADELAAKTETLTAANAENHMAQQYVDRLSQSLDLESPEIFDNYLNASQVGGVPSRALTFASTPASSGVQVKKPKIDQPKDVYRSTDFVQADMNNARDQMMAQSANAAFDKDTGKIKLYPPKEHSEQELNALLEKGDVKRYEYVKGNQLVDEAIRLHEHSHLEDFQYNGQNTLVLPTDIAKADRLTETKAYAVENLYMANQYTLLKQQGIEMVGINNEYRPIDDLLDIYPGLKETVKQIETETNGKGFDAQSPAHVRKIVENASQQWHQNRIEMYQSQHITSAKQDAVCKNLFDCVQHDDETYDKVSKQMTNTKVYIGNNTSCDLSGCKDLLDTLTTEQAQELLSTKKISHTIDLTYGDVKKIDDYLTNEQHLADTGEKTGYFNDNYENIVTRKDPVDAKLKALMLSLDKSNNNTIIYADLLKEQTDANGHTIVSDENGNVDITDFNEKSANLQADMIQTRTEYEAKLTAQTAAATQANSAENASSPNTAGNTVSPAALRQIQQQGR